MSTALDTGLCVQESFGTLAQQQQQLVNGKRSVQMFPVGTVELIPPDGMSRYVNKRGVFHYDPEKITFEQIEQLSSDGRENEFLNLGPYNKFDIALRTLGGESLLFVTEYTPDGVEVRSAAGTNTTIATQRAYFEHTKETGNTIVVGAPPPRVSLRIKKVR